MVPENPGGINIGLVTSLFHQDITFKLEAAAMQTLLDAGLQELKTEIAAWFAKKKQDGIPIFGVEQQGTVVGFATWGTFRPYPAYSKTAEHSVYIAREYQRRGFGRLLLETIIQEATAREIHLLVAGIDSANEASIALHRHAGFSHAGTIQEAGYKFKRWLNLEFWQRLLK